MSPLAAALREEITRQGPISFERYMELSLYHPQFGYYRRTQDPFGKRGDYFTAEQLQPVFGILIAARIRQLREEMGNPQEFTVVEVGAGRGEMAEALSEFRYVPVDVGSGALPEQFTGVLFANEFFDALPVSAAKYRDGAFRQMRVDWNDDRLAWTEGEAVQAEEKEYVEENRAPREEGFQVEIALQGLRHLERIERCLDRGYVFAIDYGYTSSEWIRFPAGTLMSYRKHAAEEDVLSRPGEQDITAHVCFSALERHAGKLGLHKICLESMARTLLQAGESDQFAGAVDAPSERERLRRRMQLKTLLYGMGESFRTLLLGKGVEK